MNSVVGISVKTFGDGDFTKETQNDSFSNNKKSGTEASCVVGSDHHSLCTIHGNDLSSGQGRSEGGCYNETFDLSPETHDSSLQSYDTPCALTDNVSQNGGDSIGVKEKQKDGLASDVMEPGHVFGDCGFGKCNPKFMQRFKSVVCFTGVYSVSGLVTSALSIYIGSQITTLERHFNFSSSTSGFLMSCNDIGFFISCLFLSYLARRIHIPKGLALSTIIVGISGLICTIPYFGTREQIRSVRLSVINNESSASPSQMCDHVTSSSILSSVDNDNTTSCNDSPGSRKGGVYGISDQWSMMAVVIIAVGMVIQGVAKSPRPSFVTIYIDDNGPKSKTALYIGIIGGMAIFGPSLAFILAGLFSSLYITLEDTNLNRRDPRFLGAWWLGFLVFGSVSLVVGIPLLCFPRKLVIKQEVEKVERKRRAKCEGKNKLLYETKSFLKTTLKLGLNPLYVLLTLSDGIKLMSIGGSIAFYPKYLESYFGLPTWKVNISFGALKVIGACIGSVLGGIITSKSKMSPRTCLKMITGITILTIAVNAIGFFIICDQPKVNSGQNEVLWNGSHCLANCHCNMDAYFPVCGDDGRNYFSPCHAGCSDIMIFSNCSCLEIPGVKQARGGLCESSCEAKFWVYIVLTFFSSLGLTITGMPTFIAKIRSVPEAQKPMAVGVSSFMASLIGWFPGPILFGFVIDTTCSIWQTTSSCTKKSKGACLLYDFASLRNTFHGLMTGLQVCSLVLVLCSLIYATLSSKDVFLPNKDNDEDDEKNTTNLPRDESYKLKEGKKNAKNL